MAKLRRIGLLGGSFDPLHIGHVLMGRWARTALNLDEVWYVPAAWSPDGKRLSAGGSRLRRLREKLRSERGLQVSDVDLRLGGKSRAVRTLEKLHAETSGKLRLTWILGQDQAAQLNHWAEPDHLAELCDFAFVPRSNSPAIPKSVHSRFRIFAIYIPSIEISSTRIRSNLSSSFDLDLAKLD